MRKFLASLLIACLAWAPSYSFANPRGLSGGLAVPVTVANGGTGGATGQAAAASLTVPYILAKSFVAVSAGADTSEDTLATITVPANALAANGVLRITWQFTHSGAGGTRTVRVRYSGASGTQYLNQALGATRVSITGTTIIGNRNATNSQSGSSIGVQDNGAGLASAAAGNVTSAVDTTASTTAVITCQKASAGDVCTLDGYVAELLSSGT